MSPIRLARISEDGSTGRRPRRPLFSPHISTARRDFSRFPFRHEPRFSPSTDFSHFTSRPQRDAGHRFSPRSDPFVANRGRLFSDRGDPQDCPPAVVEAPAREVRLRSTSRGVGRRPSGDGCRCRARQTRAPLRRRGRVARPARAEPPRAKQASVRFRRSGTRADRGYARAIWARRAPNRVNFKLANLLN